MPRPSHPDRRDAIQNGTVNAVFDEGIKSWGQTAVDSGFIYLPIEGQILKRLTAMGYQTSVVPKSRFKGNDRRRCHRRFQRLAHARACGFAQ